MRPCAVNQPHFQHIQQMHMIPAAIRRQLHTHQRFQRIEHPKPGGRFCFDSTPGATAVYSGRTFSPAITTCTASRTFASIRSGPSRKTSMPATCRRTKPAPANAAAAASKSDRFNRMPTSCVLRTAAESIVATHTATAFPPTTAYGIFAASNAAVALASRSPVPVPRPAPSCLKWSYLESSEACSDQGSQCAKVRLIRG